MEKNQIEGIVSKANMYLEIGHNKDSLKPLEQDKKIAQNWIYGVSHLKFNETEFITSRNNQLHLRKANSLNYFWNESEQILIPKIYNQLEKNLEDSTKNLKTAQNQPSTYDVLKNDPEFPSDLLENASKDETNNVYSSIDDLAHITAQSINEVTGNAVEIEGYKEAFFQKPKGEPRKAMNVWGQSKKR